jgi:cobalamin biosynthesis Mg chelatase CobN
LLFIQCKTTKHIEQSASTELHQSKTDSIAKVTETKSKTETKTDSSKVVTEETITTSFTVVKNSDNTTSSVPTKQTVSRKTTQQNAVKKRSTENDSVNNEIAKTSVDRDKKGTTSTDKTTVKPSLLARYWYWFVVLIIFLVALFKLRNFLKIL